MIFIIKFHNQAGVERVSSSHHKNSATGKVIYKLSWKLSCDHRVQVTWEAYLHGAVVQKMGLWMLRELQPPLHKKWRHSCTPKSSHTLKLRQNSYKVENLDESSHRSNSKKECNVGNEEQAHQIGRARSTRWAPQAQLPLLPPELGGILLSHLWRQSRTTSCLHCATLAILASRSSSRKLELNHNKPNWFHSITTSSSTARAGIRIRSMKVCNVEFFIGKPKP